MFPWIESTAIARSVGGSLWLTASLSAVHILGFTLIMGSALVSNLRMLDAVLPQVSLMEVIRPTNRAIVVGLAISLTTGVLQFSPRAISVAANSTFQTKMLLLLVAVVFHFMVQSRVARTPESGVLAMRTTAAAGLTLWMGLALAACWFILFE